MELQFSLSALEAFVLARARRPMDTLAIPPEAGFYLDRVDVVGPVRWQDDAPAGTQVARLSVAIHVVTEQALLARPNAEPDGVDVPRFSGEVLVRVAVEPGTTAQGVASPLCLVVSPLTPPLPDWMPAPHRERLTAALATSAAVVDLRPLFQGLSLPVPQRGSVVREGGLLVVRFDDAPPLGHQLPPGSDWAACIEAPALVARGLAQVPEVVEGWPVQRDAHWDPAGGVPRLRVRAVVRGDKLGLAFQAVVDAVAVLSLQGGPRLRTRTDWQVQVDVALAPDPIDALVADEVRPIVRDGMVAQARPDASGDDWMERSDPLPSLPFGGLTLRVSALSATPQGMALGGRLPAADLALTRLAGSFDTFDVPRRLTFCSLLARTGGGDPPRTVSAWEAFCVASFRFRDGGSYLGCEVLRGPPSIVGYLEQPATGSPENPGAVVVRLPAAIAHGLDAGIRIVIRTSRGVRCLDPGRPRVQLDADGQVTNAIADHIDDCLVMPEGWRGLRWGAWDGLPGDVERPWRPVPLEHPDWRRLLDAARGFVVQRVRLAGLLPGEPVTLASALQHLQLTADADGRLHVPVLLLPGEALGAWLRCAVSRPAALRIRVDPVVFEPRGPLGPEPGAAPEPARADGPLQAARAWGREKLLSPQPLPPVEHPLIRAAGLAERAVADGWEVVASVPGFGDREAAVVRLGDGDGLLLEPTETGARISGRYVGPIGIVHLEGDWACSPDPQAPGRGRLFRVRRPDRH